MNNKIDIIATLIEVIYGIDYSDRYFRPKNIHNYVFECDKQRYVWQSKKPCKVNLVDGRIYHINATVGARLLGGRGLSISEVEFVGEIRINEVDKLNGEDNQSKGSERWIN